MIKYRGSGTSPDDPIIIEGKRKDFLSVSQKALLTYPYTLYS